MAILNERIKAQNFNNFLECFRYNLMRMLKINKMDTRVLIIIAWDGNNLNYLIRKEFKRISNKYEDVTPSELADFLEITQKVKKKYPNLKIEKRLD